MKRSSASVHPAIRIRLRYGQIPLHADANLPPPLPSYAALCNINYALTDYTKESECLAIAVPYARPFMKLQERYGDELPQSVIDRNSHHPRFRQLAALEDSCGWKEEGPKFLDQVKGGYTGEFVNRKASSAHYS